MKYGFVYLMVNPAMRGYYKIGCTERPPHQRLEELSSSTSIPLPFELVCYIEVQDCQRVESNLHHHLSDFRVNPSREFFAFHRESAAWLLGIFKFHPQCYSFTEVDLSYLVAAEPGMERVDPWSGRNEIDGPELPRNGPMRLFEIPELG